MYNAAVRVTRIRHPLTFTEGGLLTHSHLFGTAFGVTHEQATGKGDGQNCVRAIACMRWRSQAQGIQRPVPDI